MTALETILSNALLILGTVCLILGQIAYFEYRRRLYTMQLVSIYSDTIVSVIRCKSIQEVHGVVDRSVQRLEAHSNSL